MIFVLDSNILFSGLVKDGKTREILLYSQFTFYTAEKVLSEIRKYESLILEESGLTKEEFEELFGFLISRVTVVSKKEYEKHIKEALDIIGHIDPDDAPYIAVALARPCNGIWSDDSHFNKQKKVKHWKTINVLKAYESS